MFTGIIRAVAMIEDTEKQKNGLEMRVRSEKSLGRIGLGSSVAVSGVCLTVVGKNKRVIRFDVVPETAQRTTLGSLKKGDRVNIEPSLRVGDEIGGHFVLGHADGVGVVKALRQKGTENILNVQVPKKLMRYIAEKGSVAVDGVSLTIAAVRGNSFTIALVPFTLKHTTLGSKKKGDLVNVEIDTLSRYPEMLMKSRWHQFDAIAPK